MTQVLPRLALPGASVLCPQLARVYTTRRVCVNEHWRLLATSSQAANTEGHSFGSRGGTMKYDGLGSSARIIRADGYHACPAALVRPVCLKRKRDTPDLEIHY